MQRNRGQKSLKEMRRDEQELILRVQQGDEMAFSEIVRAYKDKITNFLWQLTGDYQKAAELGILLSLPDYLTEEVDIDGGQTIRVPVTLKPGRLRIQLMTPLLVEKVQEIIGEETLMKSASQI